MIKSEKSPKFTLKTLKICRLELRSATGGFFLRIFDDRGILSWSPLIYPCLTIVGIVKWRQLAISDQFRSDICAIECSVWPASLAVPDQWSVISDRPNLFGKLQTAIANWHASHALHKSCISKELVKLNKTQCNSMELIAPYAELRASHMLLLNLRRALLSYLWEMADAMWRRGQRRWHSANRLRQTNKGEPS